MRSTTYYVIVLQEVVHSMMKSRRGTGDLIFKLDLKKAYDRWIGGFLRLFGGIWFPKSIMYLAHYVLCDLCVSLGALKWG